MSLLGRKLRRDMRRAKGQFLAVLTMVVMGVALLAAVYGAYANLRSYVDEKYEELSFADFVIAFNPAPSSIAEEVAGVSGVEGVQGRVVIEAPLSLGEGKEPVVGRLLSVPASGRAAVNDVRVESGRLPAGGAAEALIEQRFAEHHGIELGSVLYLVNSTGQWPYEVTGKAVSPEYLWPARNLRDHMPDVLRRWGVLFLLQPDLQAFAGIPGAVNEVAVTVRPDAERDDVVEAATALLSPLGITGVVTRANQPSDMVIRLTVDALAQVALVLPLFFLIIVALSTYVLLSRLVYVQRSQIGMLRALGYSKRRMLSHYLGYALFLGLSGSLVGFSLGYLLSYPVTSLFAETTNLRGAEVLLRPDILALGTGLSLGFTAMAGIVPAWRASRLGPADAMRPPAPVWGRKPILGRRGRKPSRASATWRLSTRNLLRNPRRTFFTILGLSLAVSVLLVPLSFIDSMNWATHAQQELIQRYDLKAYLQYPLPVEDLSSLDAMDEVASAEPMIELPTSLMRNGQGESILLMALEPSSRLYGLYDRSWAPTNTGEGILLSGVYERKGFQVGDEVQLLSRPTQIAGFVSDFGTTGFVTLGRAQELLGMEGMATAVMLKLSSGVTEEEAQESLFALLPVLTFESTRESISDWNEMMGLYYGFIYLLLAFGIAIGVAIVFNAVTINVMEESRDLATMRTFGTPNSHLRRLITVETLLLAVPGALLGLIVGTLLTGYFTSLYSSDMFVLDPIISLQTYLLAFGAAIIVALLSELPSLRYVRGMSLAKVTKERVS